MASPHINKKNVLTKRPLKTFNKKLARQLTKAGFKSVELDFDAVDPLGDFVEDSSLPIPVLAIAQTGAEHQFLRPMCVMNVDRGADMTTWWKENEVWLYSDFVQTFNLSLEKQKEEGLT